MRLLLVSQVVILAASLAGCQHPDYSLHVLEISSMPQEKLTDWSAPVNGLCARVEMADFWYGDVAFVRLKNVGGKALTIPLSNPQDKGMKPFFELQLMDSDGWRAFSNISHACGGFLPDHEGGLWEMPYVTLRTGEDVLAMLRFDLPDWKWRCSVIKIRLAVQGEGDARWAGVLETPEKPIYASYAKQLPVPTYIPEPSRHWWEAPRGSGPFGAGYDVFEGFLRVNADILLIYDMYDQAEVQDIMGWLMTDEHDRGLKLCYAYLSRKAEADAPKPSTRPAEYRSRRAWPLLLGKAPSPEDVIRHGLQSNDYHELCVAIDAAVEVLTVSPTGPLRAELESLRKTLQSENKPESPSDSMEPAPTPPLERKDALPYVEEGLCRLTRQEEDKRSDTQPANEPGKRQQIEQLLAKLKSPVPYVMKGSHSADEVAGDIARNLRRLTGQPMGGDWRAWDLWWQTKGKAMDWKH